jgi:hypothetical protein
LKVVRAITGNSIPVLSWIAVAASSTLRLYGPENLGGLGDVAAKAIEESRRTGKKTEEAADEVSALFMALLELPCDAKFDLQMYRPSEGKLVPLPGIPPMYDYEWSPQQVELKLRRSFSALTTDYNMHLASCQAGMLRIEGASSVQRIRKQFK